jgi:hypothetical protein
MQEFTAALPAQTGNWPKIAEPIQHSGRILGRIVRVTAVRTAFTELSMPEQSLDSMTLREKLKTASGVLRELVEHLDQGFLPKVRELGRMVEPLSTTGVYRLKDDTTVSDHTIRDQVAQILSSESFTDEVYGKAEQFFTAIETEVAKILVQT